MHCLSMVPVSLAATLAATLIAAPHETHADEDPAPKIEAVTRWQTALPDSDVLIKYRVIGEKPTQLAWELKAHHRVLERGKQRIKKKDDARYAELKLRMPPLKKEVSLNIELHARLEDADGEALGDAHVKRISLLTPDVFAGLQAWLENLDIVLYDPEKATIERFEKAEIPCRVILGLDALAATDSSFVIVGEGVRFDSSGPLADVLWKLARRGASVLVLAPEPGMVIPVSEDKTRRSKAFAAIGLRHRDVITRFDKRLDAEQWQTFDVPQGGLELNLDKGKWSIDAVEGECGWSWIDLPLKKSAGRITLCRLPIVRHWDDGPTPRYMFLQMLKHMQSKQNKSHKFSNKEKS